MTAPLLAVAGLSKTFVPAGHCLAGLDDVSLAPGDAFRFDTPLPVGVRPGEAAP